MQDLLLQTEHVFAGWVHFWTLNGAPTLQFARIPNVDGGLVIPEEDTIVSAISHYQGASTNLYIKMGAFIIIDTITPEQSFSHLLLRVACCPYEKQRLAPTATRW
jgi:hypothetical protein